jgi:hypothetical protein
LKVKTKIIPNLLNSFTDFFCELETSVVAYQVNPDPVPDPVPDPGFDDQRFLLKGRPSCRRSLQPSKENIWHFKK